MTSQTLLTVGSVAPGTYDPVLHLTVNDNYWYGPCWNPWSRSINPQNPQMSHDVTTGWTSFFSRWPFAGPGCMTPCACRGPSRKPQRPEAQLSQLWKRFSLTRWSSSCPKNDKIENLGSLWVPCYICYENHWAVTLYALTPASRTSYQIAWLLLIEFSRSAIIHKFMQVDASCLWSPLTIHIIMFFFMFFYSLVLFSQFPYSHISSFFIFLNLLPSFFLFLPRPQSRVLTMERIEGVPFSDICADPHGPEATALLCFLEGRLCKTL